MKTCKCYQPSKYVPDAAWTFCPLCGRVLDGASASISKAREAFTDLWGDDECRVFSMKQSAALDHLLAVVRGAASPEETGAPTKRLMALRDAGAFVDVCFHPADEVASAGFAGAVSVFVGLKDVEQTEDTPSTWWGNTLEEAVAAIPAGVGASR